MNLALCIASNSSVHADFAMNLACVMLYTSKACSQSSALVLPEASEIVVNQSKKIENMPIISQRNELRHVARNRMVMDAVELDVDYIMLLNSDMVLPPNIIEKLLSVNQDIVGVNYSTATKPLRPVAKDLDGKPFLHADGIRQASHLGLGCILVKTEVFRKIGLPYFFVEWDGKQKQYINDDICFCSEVKKAGYELWCDCSAAQSVGRLGSMTFTV